jgi:hypothetical protein
MRTLLIDNELIRLEMEEGIVIGIWKVTYVDLKMAQTLVEFRKRLTEYKEYPLIADIRPVKTTTKEARDFLASEDGCDGISAAALIIGSPVSTMVGNFWIRINKPLRPSKLFTHEKEAKQWLAQYVK